MQYEIEEYTGLVESRDEVLGYGQVTGARHGQELGQPLERT